MASAPLRPNADVLNQWAITNGGATEAWQVLDDAVTQPTEPGTASDYVQESTNTEVCEVHVGTVAVSSVSEAKLWWHGLTGLLSSGGTAKLFKGVTEIATASYGGNLGAAWRSVTYTGGLTQAELDDLRIRFTCAGGADPFRVHAAYVDLTYEPPVVGGGKTRMMMGVG